MVILVADHAMRYPAGIQEADILRHHIPMVWTGGVIKSPRVIYDYASQIDIAATLLGQLGISYDDFIFSKNLANPNINLHIIHLRMDLVFWMQTIEWFMIMSQIA